MLTPKTIMVVDDEVGIRKLLFEVLSDKGFNVTLAKDGYDSLRQMKNRCFDLVITDINMPRLNGIELLRRMKKEGRKESVIIMTGTPFDQKRLSREMPPVSTRLNKPFQLKNILDAVALALTPGSGGRKRRGRIVTRKKGQKCYQN